MYLHAERETPDRLRKVTYRFYVSVEIATGGSIIVTLDSYAELDRPTRRHNYKPVKQWNRLSRWENTIETPPPIPDDVTEECSNQLRGRVVWER